eukprot:616728-Pelagomonas_calceolata.AAC.4
MMKGGTLATTSSAHLGLSSSKLCSTLTGLGCHVGQLRLLPVSVSPDLLRLSSYMLDLGRQISTACASVQWQTEQDNCKSRMDNSRITARAEWIIAG